MQYLKNEMTNNYNPEDYKRAAFSPSGASIWKDCKGFGMLQESPVKRSYTESGLENHDSAAKILIAAIKNKKLPENLNHPAIEYIKECLRIASNHSKDLVGVETPAGGIFGFQAINGTPDFFAFDKVQGILYIRDLKYHKIPSFDQLIVYALLIAKTFKLGRLLKFVNMAYFATTPFKSEFLHITKQKLIQENMKYQKMFLENNTWNFKPTLESCEKCYKISRCQMGRDFVMQELGSSFVPMPLSNTHDLDRWNILKRLVKAAEKAVEGFEKELQILLQTNKLSERELDALRLYCNTYNRGAKIWNNYKEAAKKFPSGEPLSPSKAIEKFGEKAVKPHFSIKTTRTIKLNDKKKGSKQLENFNKFLISMQQTAVRQGGKDGK